MNLEKDFTGVSKAFLVKDGGRGWEVGGEGGGGGGGGGLLDHHGSSMRKKWSNHSLKISQ